MRTYSNVSTHRLEELAEKEGVHCDIRVAEAQQDGRYFVVNLDDEPLKQPVPLGFTDEEAEFSIKGHRWERFVLRGAPNRLRPS